MLRTLKHFGRYSDRRKVIVAGVLGFLLTLGVMESIDVCSLPLTKLLLSLATVIGALLGIWSAGVLSSARVRRKLAEQNARLDGAINNMVQGLCMFAADNRLVVWNERYRSMYNIDPRRIWRGCTICDLLDARIAAGTFPLDPAKYDADLRAALAQGEPFPDEIALPDGRIINVLNKPIEGGGWVATHEDITERKRAQRDLEQTRAFLNTIIENAPSPIVVKSAKDLRYLLLNRAAEQYLGVERGAMLGKRAAEVMPKSTADQIEEQDRRLRLSARSSSATSIRSALPAMARASSPLRACR